MRAMIVGGATAATPRLVQPGSTGITERRVFSGSGRATRRIACACALTLLGWAAAPARAEPPALLVISTGQYGMRREIPHALGIGLEIRAPWQWTVIRPSFGLLTTARGGAYLYSGIVADIPLPLDL